ncbi:hypothetical protein O6H91_15G001700 [Diphasiastrum complanatum]|uniref:Uncharacterized protein n=1 Tax=Diphasiastrum complanatum TaxID=34168 RepID=A0ACC2BEX1_DIPCM|nr:hypothetical protein O6H91_15G001700 [Diphasiastrum complanatum]
MANVKLVDVVLVLCSLVVLFISLLCWRMLWLQNWHDTYGTVPVNRWSGMIHMARCLWPTLSSLVKETHVSYCDLHMCNKSTASPDTCGTLFPENMICKKLRWWRRSY